MDLVELALAVEELLRGRQVEHGHRRAANRDAGELHDPGDAELLHRAVRLDADRVALLVVIRGGRFLVDRDLVAPVRPPAGDELERIEARRPARDAEAEIRRATVDDGLSVTSDQLRGAVELSVGGRDIR
jgi:hypothetical protein